MLVVSHVWERCDNAYVLELSRITVRQRKHVALFEQEELSGGKNQINHVYLLFAWQKTAHEFV